jgi:hypothetical protein
VFFGLSVSPGLIDALRQQGRCVCVYYPLYSQVASHVVSQQRGQAGHECTGGLAGQNILVT